MLIRAICVAFVALFGLALLGFGLFLAWFAAKTLWHSGGELLMAWRSRHWAATRGTVERAVLTRMRTRRVTTEGARIAYAFVVDGRTYTSMRCRFAATLGGPDGVLLSQSKELLARFPAGAEVEVFYDPADPERSTLDRGVPAIGPSTCIALLLLAFAPLFAYLGAQIVLGSLDEPSDWTAEDMPPLGSQIGGLLAVVAAVAAGAAWRAGRRAARQKATLDRLAGAAPTPIGELAADRDAAIFGTVEPGDGDALSAPITDAAVVYHRTAVSSDFDARTEVGEQRPFVVHDGTGRVLVEPEGAIDHLPVIAVPRSLAAVAWVDDLLGRNATAVPEDFRVEQRRLAPGDPVLVLGRVRRDGRAGPLVLRSRDEAGEPLLLAPEPLARAIRRFSEGARMREAWRWVAGLALLGALLAFAI
ncbi:MAG: DUF3592 domain-containing protein [Planctomycetota bacterium]